jgi:excisionase family DNA binding protein
MKRLMTAQETADHLGFKLATIRKWTHLKFIPFIKLRGGVRFDPDEVDEWRKQHSTPGRANRTRL